MYVVKFYESLYKSIYDKRNTSKANKLNAFDEKAEFSVFRVQI